MSEIHPKSIDHKELQSIPGFFGNPQNNPRTGTVRNKRSMERRDGLGPALKYSFAENPLNTVGCGARLVQLNYDCMSV